MRVGIMQPYFLPYIGYFQLINHCDQFVIYDDIEFTKRGWINRNRILANGEPRTITLPVRKDSDFLDIREREISNDFNPAKMLNLLRESYRRAPFWEANEQRLGEILEFADRNLFAFLSNSLTQVCASLEIDTPLVVSSTLGVDNSLRGSDRVIATCEALGATEYVNPIGGVELYSPENFAEHGLELSFLRSGLSPYPQLGGDFVEGLSIVDALVFFDSADLTERLSSDFELTAA